MKRKIVLTGGHLTPAMALVEVLKKHDWEIYYFGRTKAMVSDKHLALEAKVIPGLGVTFMPLITGRFKRKITLQNIILILKFPVGIIHALFLLIKVRPDIVVSFGGYLGLPTVIAAWLLRIPAIIHEQISVAGLANKLSIPFVTKIAISFPSSKKYYPDKKVVLTGNPIQSGVFKVDNKVKKKYASKFKNKQMIFVTGGNQGARDLNKIVLQVLPKLLTKYNVIHQIGSTEAQDPEWERAQKMLRNQGYPAVNAESSLDSRLRGNDKISYFPVRFIPHEKMGTVYDLADLVICRSGANTISELGALNKPALLVPLEPTLMDEQLLNAKYLAQAGLVMIRHEKNLTSGALINQINEMFKNLGRYKLKKEHRKVFRRDGAVKLYKIITETTK